MKILKKIDLEKHGHDVYEFCTALSYPNDWSENSIYISMEDFLIISPYIDKVFFEYHYFGPQKVTLQEWKTVEKSALLENRNKELIDLFKAIDRWIVETNSDYDYFWILGI